MWLKQGFAVVGAVAFLVLAGYHLSAQTMPLTGTCHHSTVGPVVGKTIHQGPGGASCQKVRDVQSVTLWIDAQNRRVPLTCTSETVDVCWCVDEVEVGSHLEAQGPIVMDGDQPLLLIAR